MVKKKINSRAKGKRGELEASKFIEAFGFKCRRSQQFSGQEGNGDLKHNIPGVHIEVKYVERLNVYEALAQAERDCQGNTPIVLHRRSRGQWYASLPANTLMRMLAGGEDFSDL